MIFFSYFNSIGVKVLYEVQHSEVFASLYSLEQYYSYLYSCVHEDRGKIKIGIEYSSSSTRNNKVRNIYSAFCLCNVYSCTFNIRYE